ncbi:MAG: endonuclease/exonuclease/phosphatase family protein [Chloroflexi bacterium]|nr:endonuclease/exonuclease/phosphatase family protein [Chloroflexota bacterium]
MITKTSHPFTARLKLVFGVALSFILVACAVTPTSTVAPATSASPTIAAPTLASAVAPTKSAGTAIHDIQGAGHISPLAGKTVKGVQGIVIAIRSDGFYMQDSNSDNDEATSEGIFVFTTTLPKVKIGDLVNVEGDVKEFYPRDIATGDLPITEIIKPTFTVVSSGNKLPDPIIIGTGGRIPPNKVIKSEKGDADQTKFNPKTDGIDFYESLESMLVQVNDAVAVGPTSRFREIPIVGDKGANATYISGRGAMVISAEDYNPERIHLDDVILPTPTVNVGDRFTKPIIGIMDYTFGNYKLQITQRPSFESSGIKPEVTVKQKENQIAVATFNVENFAANGDAQKIKDLAKIIVENLQSPDIIGIEEIQDNNGVTDNGLVDATETYKVLVKAIKDAGGPAYDFRDIAPENGQDGGAPGGNIRVGFMFRADRGVKFVDRPGGTATKPVTAIKGSTGVELSFSPGRVTPTDSAYNNSRKPLAGEFTYNGHKLIVIVNHFNSKGGDDALMGRRQPPQLASEGQRINQARLLADFIKTIFAIDANANVLVIGDLNDFQFSPPLAKLKEVGLTDLMEILPVNERYDYLYEGNAQALDHILASPNLMKTASPEFKPMHINSEFALRASDHDPLVARFTLPPK